MAERTNYYERTIRFPRSFFSEFPPARIIGSECEYNIQNDLILTEDIPLERYINHAAIYKTGLIPRGEFLSNGAKLYEDVGHLEYATPECLGPLQAAAADMAGVIVMKRITESSGVPHRGVFRITGSYFENGPSYTSGYHENFMMPRETSNHYLVDQLIPSHLASRLWGMSGALRNEYAFSQKIWGIGGVPVTRQVERRTSHGDKPMCMIPPSYNDADVLGSDDWARLEIRFADSGLSPTARYLGFAATSLVLRIIEHADKLKTKKLHRLGFNDPVEAAKRFANDTSLCATAYNVNDKAMSAIDMQESLAETALALQNRVELPEDEVRASLLWLSLCDSMRKSKDDKKEIQHLRETYDYAAKHFYLSKHYKDSELEAANPGAQQRSLIWDRIIPEGGGLMWWKKFTSPYVSVGDIEYLTSHPPLTRASLRAERIIRDSENQIEEIQWSSLNYKNGTYVPLTDPYRSAQ